MGESLFHKTYLLTQVPALGTVPQEERPSVLQMVWKGASGAGAGAGVTGEVGHQAVSPQVWEPLLPASPAPETVKLMKAMEPQD